MISQIVLKNVNLQNKNLVVKNIQIYKPKNKVRIVTAASLFDGHDAAINIMRRIIQATGCEVIHLGHDRSVAEIVNCAIEEDVNAIANAIANRCRIPPLNSCGYAPKRSVLIPTLLRQCSAISIRQADDFSGLWPYKTSRRCSPAVKSGFKRVMGS